MRRNVFYSFHYAVDGQRAAQVRNMGSVEGNEPAKDNDWESVTSGGDRAIQRWIDEQLAGRSCTVVLIGSETANRKWVRHEIQRSWNLGKGVVGVHIHGLKNLAGEQSAKGSSPFEGIDVGGTEWLSTIARSYDPPYYDSKQVYGYISSNLASWIEEAISIRAKY